MHSTNITKFISNNAGRNINQAFRDNSVKDRKVQFEDWKKFCKKS